MPFARERPGRAALLFRRVQRGGCEGQSRGDVGSRPELPGLPRTFSSSKGDKCREATGQSHPPSCHRGWKLPVTLNCFSAVFERAGNPRPETKGFMCTNTIYLRPKHGAARRCCCTVEAGLPGAPCRGAGGRQLRLREQERVGVRWEGRWEPLRQRRGGRAQQRRGLRLCLLGRHHGISFASKRWGGGKKGLMLRSDRPPPFGAG